MATIKQVEVRVTPGHWPPSGPPAALVTAQGLQSLDVRAALLFTALNTRPPISYGFSLADCWAWLRYFPALSSTPELRLRQEWTTLDPHQKTVLSEDFGVGFTTWFLSTQLGFNKYADTIWVVNTARPGLFSLAAKPGKVGPKKSPDYIAEDALGRFSVLECKGTQTSRKALADAIKRGREQKSNLMAIKTPLQHSLVAGLFVPQFENSDTSLLVVDDPDPPILWRELSLLSPDDIGRGVSQVAFAKELLMLELFNTASCIVRGSQGDDSVAAAFHRDASVERPDRTMKDGVEIQREYLFSRPAPLSDGSTFAGVRFHASLPASWTHLLRTTADPSDIGARQRDITRGRSWTTITSPNTEVIHSPLGATYRISLLPS